MASVASTAQLVVIGSSAGGIEALSTFVASLPEDFPAPIVIAQHLDPQYPSRLREILAARTTLPVHASFDQEHMQVGHIYVIPADRHVTIADTTLTLLGDHIGRPKPSINLLFSTAAEAYGEGLIAVILTGSGSDGAVGAQEVKRAGGAVIIQNPATAAFPSMPRSLAPTVVDFVMNIAEIGPLVYDLLTNNAALARPAEARSFQAFLQQLHERSGLDFTAYKPPTIQRRLQRRMVATGATTLATYRRYLNTHPDEYSRLISAFLIKVTEFFRDRDLFSYLRETTLPELIEAARQRGYELRLWSAGCATGEEAYSLAILLAELLGDELDRFTIRIFATDLDTDAINFARRGVYSPASLQSLPPDIVERYFHRIDGEYEVRKRVRNLVVFGQHDLGQRAPFPRIDLILCRNVLIYFSQELQRRVLHLFAYSLRDQGYLVLGKAESVSPLSEYFATVQPAFKLYRRYGERLPIPVGQFKDAPTLNPVNLGASLGGLTLLPTRDVSRARSSIEKLGALVFNLPIGVVVVDRRYDVQIINSLAHQLLEIHRSAIGEDLLHLAERVPTKPLRAIIDGALHNETQPPTQGTLPIETEAGPERFLHVVGYPHQFEGDDGPVASVLLLITDVTEQAQAQQREIAAPAQPDAASAPQPKAADPNTIIQRLEAENRQLTTQAQRLMAANRELRDANRDLTATNVELHQANEEYLVNTEEVQAAAEEVETLNEELQATNEELETLNEELQATVEELNATNDDLEARSGELQGLAQEREEQRKASEAARSQLEAVLLGMADAVLVVNSAGQTILVNRAYTQWFGVGETPPFADERGVPVESDALPRQRAARGEVFTSVYTMPLPVGESVGFGETTRWYEASGRPIEVEGVARGGVVVIRDISERSLRRLQTEFLALASHELNTPLTAAQTALQMAARTVAAMERGARASEQNDGAARWPQTGVAEGSGSHIGRETPTVEAAPDSASHSTGATAEFLQRQIEMSLRQVRHLGTLIGDLVDVGRLQTGKLRLQAQPVALRDIVEQAVQTVQLTTTQEITLTAPDEPLMMNGDAIRIDQIIFNLLNDAVVHASQSKRVDVRLRREGNRAELQVQDYGPGIAADKLPHLFNRFFQVDRVGAHKKSQRQGGLGVGLFITRELANAHGGDVSVSSRPGVGTTFTVTLPLLPD